MVKLYFGPSIMLKYGIQSYFNLPYFYFYQNKHFKNYDYHFVNGEMGKLFIYLLK